MRYPQSHPTRQQQRVVLQSTPVMSQPPASLTNDHLAKQLQHNWLSKNPKLEHLVPATGAKDPLDDSLTSLNWLQNMNLNLAGTASAPSISPRPGTGNEATRVNPNQVLATKLMHQQSPLVDIQMGHPEVGIDRSKIDYKTNPYIKPHHRYVCFLETSLS